MAIQYDDELKKRRQYAKQQGWSDDEIERATLREVAARKRIQAAMAKKSQDTSSDNTQIKPKEDKSNLVVNAARDVGDLAQGLFNLPGALIQAGKEGRLGDLAVETVKGIGSEYNTLLGEPVKVETDEQGNKKYSLQAPDLKKSAKFIYENPVDAALDIIPVVKPLAAAKGVGVAGKAGKVAKVAEAGKVLDEASDVSKVSKAAEIMKKVPGVGKTMDAAAEAGERVKNLVPKGMQIKARTFASGFTVPRKEAQYIKPLEVADEMLKHNRPVMGMQGWKDLASKVTGSDGLANQVVERAVTDLRTPIDIQNWSAGLDDLVKRGQVMPDVAAEARKDLMKILPLDAQETIGTADPQRVLQAMRQIEGLGQQYYREGLKSWSEGAFKNKQLGKIYQGVARDLMDNIEATVDKEGGIGRYMTPEVVAKAQEVSPRFAEQMLSAKNVKDLRRIQSPWVRLNQMINLTEDAAQAPLNTQAGRMVERSIAPLIGFGTANIPGAIMGFFAAPAIEAGIESVRFPALQAATKVGGASKAGVNSFLNAVKNTPKFVAKGATGKKFTVAQLAARGMNAGAPMSPDQINPDMPPEDVINQSRIDAVMGLIQEGITDPVQMQQIFEEQARSQGTTTDFTTDEIKNIMSGELGSADGGGQEGYDLAVHDLPPEDNNQIALTRDRAVAAMMWDLQNNKGKNIDKIKTIYEMGVGSKAKVNADVLKKYGALSTAEMNINDLEKAFNDISLSDYGALTPVNRAWRKFMMGVDPTDKENVAWKSYESLRSTLVPSMARMLGEVGNLSKTDQELAMALLPKPEDSVATARANIAKLRQILENARASLGNQQELLNSGQYVGSTSDFPSSPSDVNFEDYYNSQYGL